MKLFDNAMTLLQRALDVRLERQNVLASNAANIDTPGFKEKDVDFDRAMAGVLAADGSAGRSDAVRAATHEVESALAGIDENSVDLDRTMVAMAENGLQYGAASRAIGKKLAILKYVANDGIG
ncbi:MAG: flagellar basal body rod protein FlgB [Myxococcota bacterium]